ncbi:hypothetical protein TRAPUB_8836 [Trametes pubescens]|uniref:Uncharacterized protein n=1 Tax=Trametes pubescens TaxID=154538 RepID=A0A1M2W488_TRAPU|nr:hypothetical protein TRAPUB_8836 [Trametes pubescens]
MSRVPRPFPLVTPLDLLETQTGSWTTSIVSMHSATHLLPPSDSPPLQNRPSTRSASSASVYSQSSAPRPKTVPKKLFVANATPANANTLPRTSTYGATDRDSEMREAAPSVLQSRFSTSSMESVQSAAPPARSPKPRRLFSLRASRAEHLFRRPTAPASLPASPRPSRDSPQRPAPGPLLLNTNPFSDPLSRHGTPQTARSGFSYNSGLSYASAATPVRYAQPPPEIFYPYAPSVSYPNSNSPYGSRAASPQVYAVGPPPPPPMQMQMLPQGYAYLAPYAVHYAGAPTRAHASTPSAVSIHSMSPSIHFAHASLSPISASGHPAALTPSHPANANIAMRAPAPVHLRGTSDPLFRPYSAGPGPRVGRRGAGVYDDADLALALPNPYPYMGGAEIRRYGSVPHMRSAAGYGYGDRAPSAAATAADDPRWRAAVLQAAAAAAGRG